MGFFNFRKDSKDKISLRLSEGQKMIYEYVLAHTKGGVSLEQTRKNLEDHKEVGNYTTHDIDEAINFLQEQNKPKVSIPQTIINKQHLEADLQKELKKLSRKDRQQAIKLLKMYDEGKYLRPNEDVDNKKIIQGMI